MIPTLYTPRLTLRAPTMADLDAMIAFYEATEVEVGGYAKRDAAGAKAVLEGFIESWERHGHGMWLLENAKGDVIGGAGLGLPDGFPHHELTWFLFPDAQGKGYASEASKAVIAWGYDEAGFDPVMTYMRDEKRPGPRAGCASRRQCHPSRNFPRWRYPRCLRAALSWPTRTADAGSAGD